MGQPLPWQCKGGPAVIPQDVVPLKTVQFGIPLPTEPCKRRRDKSAPWKSLQPISTFAPLLLRRVSWLAEKGTTS
jgi:hypothetical protein